MWLSSLVADRARRQNQEYSYAVTQRSTQRSSDMGPFAYPEFVELSAVQEEDESIDSTRRDRSLNPARVRERSLTPSPLPDLIIEREPSQPDKHDEPPEFYRALETRMRRIHRRLIIENRSDIESTDSELLDISPSRPNKRRYSFGKVSSERESPEKRQTDSTTYAIASKLPRTDNNSPPEKCQNDSSDTSKNAKRNDDQDSDVDNDSNEGDEGDEDNDSNEGDEGDEDNDSDKEDGSDEEDEEEHEEEESDSGERNDIEEEGNENNSEEIGDDEGAEAMSEHQVTDNTNPDTDTSSSNVHFVRFTTTATVHRNPEGDVSDIPDKKRDDESDDETKAGDEGSHGLPTSTLCDDEVLDRNKTSEESHHIEEMRSARRHAASTSHGQESFHDMSPEAAPTPLLSRHTQSEVTTDDASLHTDVFPHRQSSGKRKSTGSSTSSSSRRTRLEPREQLSAEEQIRNLSFGVLRVYQPCVCPGHVCRERNRYEATDTRNLSLYVGTPPFKLCTCTDHRCC